MGRKANLFPRALFVKLSFVGAQLNNGIRSQWLSLFPGPGLYGSPPASCPCSTLVPRLSTYPTRHGGTIYRLWSKPG